MHLADNARRFGTKENSIKNSQRMKLCCAVQCNGFACAFANILEFVFFAKTNTFADRDSEFGVMPKFQLEIIPAAIP